VNKITKEKIKELTDRAYRIACEHGFHDVERSPEHWMMLVISEIGEIVEADRKNLRANPKGFEKCIGLTYSDRFKNYVKDSVEDELADVVIRLLDFCGMIGYYPVAVESYDLFRLTHGNKTVCEQCFYMSLSVMRIVSRGDVCKDSISIALSFCFAFAEHHGIDLVWHVEKKMDYNERRSKMHGKKY
jgi:NTP pyrophosphatase (non-canonical NTP hydrolase)